ncbi:thioredoxin, partial [Candidatus Bathyarchaeota archaeon]|nr:thioredoxin [Candidatus Bathyarchaeota archaeon]
MTPIFEKLAEEYSGKVKFARLNILESTDNRELAINFGIMGTPTLVFFCGGRPLMQVVGFMAENELRKVIEDMLSRHQTCLLKSSDLKSYIV